MKAPGLKTWHKWLGLLLLAPFAVWTLTGLLFALKPGWGPAYEYLSPWQPASQEAPSTLTMASFATHAEVADALAIELHQSAIGPLYEVQHAGDAGATTLHDARTSVRMDPLTLEHARTLVEAAIASSIDPERYGVVHSHEPAESEIQFSFSGGPTVTINLHSASMRQSGPDTDRINWLYELHYMRWTGNAMVDRILGFSVLVLVWLLAAAGLLLAWRGRKRAHDLAAES
jgi:uncharacterized iron-regulated membrane protein